MKIKNILLGSLLSLAIVGVAQVDAAPIHDAAQNGNVESVRQLIQDGVDVVDDCYGSTALAWAATNGHLDCVQLILDHNADVNHANIFGRTALIEAAYKGHTDCVRVLLARRADVNHASNSSNTALDYAERGNHSEIVKLIEDHIFDTTHRGPKTKSANKVV